MNSKDIVSLFNGIGVIIDEEIGKKASGDGINKIYKYMLNKNIPLLAYTSIPDPKVIQNFRNLSFLVLDWNLHNLPIIPPALIDENIRFIEEINSLCFIPIFIFTNEDPYDIELTLAAKGLFDANKSNNIFERKEKV